MDKFDNKNYYEILGVSQDATKDAIKRAYHEIARVYHPDSNFYAEILSDGLDSQQITLFKIITEAYNTLICDEKRSEYDAKLPQGLRDWEDPEPEQWKQTKDPRKSGAYTSTAQQSGNFTFGKAPKPTMMDSVFAKEVRSVSEMMDRRRTVKELWPYFLALGLAVCALIAIVVMMILSRS